MEKINNKWNAQFINIKQQQQHKNHFNNSMIKSGKINVIIKPNFPIYTHHCEYNDELKGEGLLTLLYHKSHSHFL